MKNTIRKNTIRVTNRTGKGGSPTVIDMKGEVDLEIAPRKGVRVHITVYADGLIEISDCVTEKHGGEALGVECLGTGHPQITYRGTELRLAHAHMPQPKERK